MEITIESLKALLKRINNFDAYYEMSDSPVKFEAGIVEEANIQTELQKLPSEDLDFLLLNFDTNGKFCYERYFKQMAE